jgi:hypothetical protein
MTRTHVRVLLEHLHPWTDVADLPRAPGDAAAERLGRPGFQARITRARVRPGG